MDELLMNKRSVAYSKNASVQRDAIESEINKINESLSKDDIWKGRFYFELCDEGSTFEQYADGSGAVLTVLVNVYDFRHRKYKQFVMDTQEILLFDYLYFALAKAFPCSGSRKYPHGQAMRRPKTDFNRMNRSVLIAQSVKENKVPVRVR